MAQRISDPRDSKGFVVPHYWNGAAFVPVDPTVARPSRLVGPDGRPVQTTQIGATGRDALAVEPVGPAGYPFVTMITTAQISLRATILNVPVAIPADLPPVLAWGFSVQGGDGLAAGLARYDVTVNHAVYLNSRGNGGMISPFALPAEGAQATQAATTHARIAVAPGPVRDLTFSLTAASAPTRGVHQITAVLYHR